MRALALAIASTLLGCAPNLPEGRIICVTNADCPPSWHCSYERCYRQPRDAGGFDGPRPDAPRVDAPGIDSGGACGFPYAPGTVDPCMLDESSDDWTVSDERVYDTDTGMLDDGSVRLSDRVDQMMPDAPMVRVVRVRNLTIESAGRLTVAGSLPLVILAWGDVSIEGALVATGLRHGTCNAGAGEPGETYMGGAPRGAGGGGGAGHGAAGGKGGRSTGAIDFTEGGTAGAEEGTTMIVPLRGGCPGGRGGDVGPLSSPGAGGEPGGAVQISAAGTVTISGMIDAGGLGGRPGDWRSSELKGDGGGGGGAGGAIVIEARAIELTATGRVCANGGGGGGGGCNSTAATAGEPGTCDFTTAAAGGAGEAGGGSGGAGASPAGSPGDDENSACGGAGGGGGVGRIRIRSIESALVRDPAAVVSPMPG